MIEIIYFYTQIIDFFFLFFNFVSLLADVVLLLFDPIFKPDKVFFFIASKSLFVATSVRLIETTSTIASANNAGQSASLSFWTEVDRSNARLVISCKSSFAFLQVLTIFTNYWQQNLVVHQFDFIVVGVSARDFKTDTLPSSMLFVLIHTLHGGAITLSATV